MANKIKLKHSAVAGRTPQVSDLVAGEVALNTADGKLFYLSNTNTVEAISSGDDITWNSISGKPAVIAAGADMATARGAIAAAQNETVVALGSAGAINLATGRLFTSTPGSSITYSLTNVPAAPNATCFILDIVAGGSKTITWFPNIKWAKGTPPTLSATRDLVGFVTNDGTNWVGVLISDAVA